ncbi:MAG: HupE/UreJ family protein, partial [bacterium]|nr:HupE/UreJ family protein [bacterium]
MKRLAVLWWILLPVPAAAHLVSISTGELVVEEATARYELRMPLFETDYMEAPEQELFEQFRLSSGGAAGELVERRCREDLDAGAFVCNAEYRFPAPVEVVTVNCSYHVVTVPNHVHILRARRGEYTDQAVFDLTGSEAEINFIPPTALEIAWVEFSAGVRRVISGLAPPLFVAALVIAARSRRELFALIGMFLGAEIISTVVLPLTGWQPAPRFVEAAAALTIAYLAVEVLLLPGVGQRWLVVGVLGLFHGFYLAAFLTGTDYAAGYLLSGVTLAELAIAAPLALVFARIRKWWSGPRPVQLPA